MDRFSTLLTVAKDLFLEEIKSRPLLPPAKTDPHEFLADRFIEFCKRLLAGASAIKDSN